MLLRRIQAPSRLLHVLPCSHMSVLALLVCNDPLRYAQQVSTVLTKAETNGGVKGRRDKDRRSSGPLSVSDDKDARQQQFADPSWHAIIDFTS